MIGSILIGLVDTLGRIFLPVILKFFMENASANSVGAALSSMLIYLMMAGILAVKPKGLFNAAN